MKCPYINVLIFLKNNKIYKTLKFIKMEGLEEEFVGFISNVFRSYGLGDLASKIIGILYLEPEAVAMEDIARKTGYSLASISNTMKILGNIGVVQRIKKPGTKKVFFYMEKDLARLNIMKLRAAQNNFIKPAKEILPQIIDKYKNRIKDEKSKQKLRIIENYHAQILVSEEILQQAIERLEEMSQ